MTGYNPSKVLPIPKSTTHLFFRKTRGLGEVEKTIVFNSMDLRKVGRAMHFMDIFFLFSSIPLAWSWMVASPASVKDRFSGCGGWGL